MILSAFTVPQRHLFLLSSHKVTTEDSFTPHYFPRSQLAQLSLDSYVVFPFHFADYPSVLRGLPLHLQRGRGTQRAPGTQQLHQSASGRRGDGHGAGRRQQQRGRRRTQPHAKLGTVLASPRERQRALYTCGKSTASSSGVRGILVFSHSTLPARGCHARILCTRGAFM